MFSYDAFNFASILKNKLYLGGNLHDIKISESDIMSIINTQKNTLELLAEEHLKKIKRMPKNWIYVENIQITVTILERTFNSEIYNKTL